MDPSSSTHMPDPVSSRMGATLRHFSDAVDRAHPGPIRSNFDVTPEGTLLRSLLPEGNSEFHVWQAEYGKIGYITGRQLQMLIRIQRSLLSDQNIIPLLKLVSVYLFTPISYKASCLSMLQTQINILDAAATKCTTLQQNIITRVRNRLLLHSRSFENLAVEIVSAICNNEETLIKAVEENDVKSIIEILQSPHILTLDEYREATKSCCEKLADLTGSRRKLFTEDETRIISAMMEQYRKMDQPNYGTGLHGGSKEIRRSESTDILRQFDSNIANLDFEADFLSEALEYEEEYLSDDDGDEEYDPRQSHEEDETLHLYDGDDVIADEAFFALKSVFSTRYVEHTREAYSGSSNIYDTIAAYCVLRGLCEVELNTRRDPRIIDMNVIGPRVPIARQMDSAILLDNPMQIYGVVLESIAKAYGFTDVAHPQIVIVVGKATRQQRPYPHILIRDKISPDEIGEAIVAIQTQQEYYSHTAKMLCEFFVKDKFWHVTICCSDYISHLKLCSMAQSMAVSERPWRELLPPNLLPRAVGCIYQVGTFCVLDLHMYMSALYEPNANGNSDHGWTIDQTGEVMCDGESIGVLGCVLHNKRRANDMSPAFPDLRMAKPCVLLSQTKILVSHTSYDVTCYPMKAPFTVNSAQKTAQFITDLTMRDGVPREVEIFGNQATYKGNKCLSSFLVEAELARSSALVLAIMLPFNTPLGIQNVGGPDHSILSTGVTGPIFFGGLEMDLLKKYTSELEDAVSIHAHTEQKPYSLRGMMKISSTVTWEESCKIPDPLKRIIQFFISATIHPDSSNQAIAVKNALMMGQIGPTSASHLGEMGIGHLVGLYCKFKSPRREVVKGVRVIGESDDKFINLFSLEFGSSSWNMFLVMSIVQALGVTNMCMEVRGSRSYLIISSREISSVKREKFRGEVEKKKEPKSEGSLAGLASELAKAYLDNQEKKRREADPE